MSTYDYIIIGAGSSGCVLASRLTTLLPNKNILLIEAGGSNDQPKIHDFRQSLYSSLDDITWNHNMPFGKLLGGTSNINQCLFVRPSPADFDYWPSNWSYNNVLDNYKNIEDVQPWGFYDPKYRGSIYTSDKSVTSYLRTPVSFYQSFKNPLAQELYNSCINTGYHPIIDYNTPFKEKEICSFMQFNVSPTYPNMRWDSYTTYIKPIYGKLINLHVMKNTMIVKILFKDNIAIGCETDKGHKIYGTEIILSCGSINTPKLLQLSGIGDKYLLRDKGIPIIMNLPAIGRNLQDHIAIFVMYKLNRPLISENLIDINIFVKDNKGRYPLQLYSIGFPKDTPAFNTKANWYGMESILNNPYSTGYIHISSSNPYDDPIIDYQYLSDSRDYIPIIDGIYRIQKIFKDIKFVSGPASIIPDNISSYIKNNIYSLCHASGTCKMTEKFNINESVVDSQCRIWGLQNIRIADASIIPTIVSANTNATCLMIGDKCARIISDNK